ncbi:MAG: 30S ribosomal protein S8 [Caldilineaceae bacterium]|jgi:small subunit ribosomal protein S8
MQSDPVADMLTRIRNASTAKHNQVVMPSSRMKADIARILTEEGFVDAYGVTEDKPQPNLVIRLKYSRDGSPVITDLERVSKPGRREYTGFREIPWVRSGLGINIISTPQGIMTGRQARKMGVGGEVVCNVW